MLSYSQDLPFGGTKASGYGRFGGPEGLRALTAPKAIIVDRWPWLIQTSIPAALDYPVRSISKSWCVFMSLCYEPRNERKLMCLVTVGREFVSGLTSLFFGDSYRAQFDGLLRVLGAR
jgi:hypothetical protein